MCWSRQEFVLSPVQFGIPYSRPRYFCLARRCQAVSGLLPFELQRNPVGQPYCQPPSHLLSSQSSISPLHLPGEEQVSRRGPRIHWLAAFVGNLCQGLALFILCSSAFLCLSKCLALLTVLLSSESAFDMLERAEQARGSQRALASKDALSTPLPAKMLQFRTLFGDTCLSGQVFIISARSGTWVHRAGIDPHMNQPWQPHVGTNPSALHPRSDHVTCSSTTPQRGRGGVRVHPSFTHVCSAMIGLPEASQRSDKT